MTLQFDPWATTDNKERNDVIIEGKAKKFFDFERIKEATKDWSIPPFYNFVIGARGNGKTRALLDVMMYSYNKGLQTVWIRNFKEYFRSRTNQAKFLDLGKRFSGVPEEFYVDQFGVYDSKGGDLVCMFAGLNTPSDLKGVEFRDVKHVLCDEFMVMKSERYPSGASESLSNLMLSMRNYVDSCILCSNFTYVTNPFFASMRIFPSKNDGVTTFKKKSTVIEVCSKEYYNRTSFDDNDPRMYATRLLSGGKDYASYEEDPNFELIQNLPLQHCREETFDIETDNVNLAFYTHSSGVWYVVEQSKGEFFNQHKMTRNDDKLHFVSNPRLMGRDTQHTENAPWLLRFIKDSFDTGVLRFRSANALYECMSIIYKL